MDSSKEREEEEARKVSGKDFLHPPTQPCLIPLGMLKRQYIQDHIMGVVEVCCKTDTFVFCFQRGASGHQVHWQEEESTLLTQPHGMDTSWDRAV